MGYREARLDGTAGRRGGPALGGLPGLVALAALAAGCATSAPPPAPASTVRLTGVRAWRHAGATLVATARARVATLDPDLRTARLEGARLGLPAQAVTLAAPAVTLDLAGQRATGTDGVQVTGPSWRSPAGPSPWPRSPPGSPSQATWTPGGRRPGEGRLGGLVLAMALGLAAPAVAAAQAGGARSPWPAGAALPPEPQAPGAHPGRPARGPRPGPPGDLLRPRPRGPGRLHPHLRPAHRLLRRRAEGRAPRRRRPRKGGPGRPGGHLRARRAEQQEAPAHPHRRAGGHPGRERPQGRAHHPEPRHQPGEGGPGPGPGEDRRPHPAATEAPGDRPRPGGRGPGEALPGPPGRRRRLLRGRPRRDRRAARPQRRREDHQLQHGGGPGAPRGRPGAPRRRGRHPTAHAPPGPPGPRLPPPGGVDLPAAHRPRELPGGHGAVPGSRAPSARAGSTPWSRSSTCAPCRTASARPSPEASAAGWRWRAASSPAPG